MAHPPIADLAAFAREHLEYEARMFTTTRDELLQNPRWRRLPLTPADGLIRCALLESCVLHFRNLVEFFFPPQLPKDDDVNAGDYVKDWGRPQLSGVLRDARIRAHKEMAHLTTKRWAGAAPQKEWDLQGLSAGLAPIVGEFLKRVAASDLLERTAAVLQAIAASDHAIDHNMPVRISGSKSTATSWVEIKIPSVNE
jgi:hypothetical protein